MRKEIAVFLRQPLNLFPFNDLHNQPLTIFVHGEKAAVKQVDQLFESRLHSPYLIDGYDTNTWPAKYILDKGGGYWHRIIALSEIDILRAANLRDFLNIPGLSLRESLLFRDKYEMKQFASSAGLLSPRCIEINSVDQIYLASKIIGFPMILKPRYGGGSVDVCKIENKYQLNQVLKKNEQQKFYHGLSLVAEEYIEGNMYHVDGLVLHDNIFMQEVSKYLSVPMNHGEGELLGGVQLGEANETATLLKIETKKFLNRIKEYYVGERGSKNYYFHAEYFVNSQGIYFCEIACRPGGTGIIDCLDARYNRKTFYDLVNAETIHGNIVTPCKPSGKVYGWITIPFGTSMKKLHSSSLVLESEKIIDYNSQKNKRSDSYSSADVAGVVIAGAESNKELKNKLQKIESNILAMSSNI